MNQSGGGHSRARVERSLTRPSVWKVWKQWWEWLIQPAVLARFGIMVGTAVVICVILRGWNPPFAYRYGYVPDETIVSRVAFKATDPERTSNLRNEASSHVRPIYRNDPIPLDLLESECFDQLSTIRKAERTEEISRSILEAFLPAEPPAGGDENDAMMSPSSALESLPYPASPSVPPTLPRLPQTFVENILAETAETIATGITAADTTVTPRTGATGGATPYAVISSNRSAELLHYPSTISPELRMERLRQALLRDLDLTNTHQNVRDALSSIRRYGLLRPSIQLFTAQINGEPEISVFRADAPDLLESVNGNLVRLDDGTRLRAAFAARLPVEIAEPLAAWWYRRLSGRFSTITLDEPRTHKARELAANKVTEVENTWLAGEILVQAGQPLNRYTLNLLRQEYHVVLKSRPFLLQWERAMAMIITVIGLLGGLGVYLRRFEPRMLHDWKHFLSLIGMIVATTILVHWAVHGTSGDLLRLELMPVLLVAQIVAIAYHREMALLVTALLLTVLAIGIGRSIPWVLATLGIVIVVVMPLVSIRSRAQLLRSGMAVALIAFLLSMLTGVLDNQPVAPSLIVLSMCTSLVVFLSCFIVAGMLPYIEKWFGVLTDISLMELGDVTHPLLEELIRRAGSTYNHSISVGSIAEAAANAIGARGLLVRIGAYYHDIGKIGKPDYFTENQGGGENRHDSLNPAMSAKVIISHVKEGVELAEQAQLPQPIIDLILQHHGTSRIEFFYRKAIRMVEMLHQQEQEKLRGQSKPESDTGVKPAPVLPATASGAAAPPVVSVANIEPANGEFARKIPSTVMTPDAAMMLDPGMGRISNPGIFANDASAGTTPGTTSNATTSGPGSPNGSAVVTTSELKPSTALPTSTPNGSKSAPGRSAKTDPAPRAGAPIEYDLREHLDETLADESLYRYPGPKPQTKEAVVLMLADCAESACRSLQEPGPAAIEEMVHSLAAQRLRDGQFDECGLTLRELDQIEEALIRALISHYHSRIRYPGQK